MKHTHALIAEGENDYAMHESATSCWITVNNISVYIVRTDEGVVVDLHKANGEMEDAIASTYAFFSDAVTTDF